jgi:hypothetical protein
LKDNSFFSLFPFFSSGDESAVLLIDFDDLTAELTPLSSFRFSFRFGGEVYIYRYKDLIRLKNYKNSG